MQKILKSTLLSIAIVTLSACDRPATFVELCEEVRIETSDNLQTKATQKICNEFTPKQLACEATRINVGIANLNELSNASDTYKYQQLIAYEKYGNCLRKTTDIEDKEALAIDNLTKSQKKIASITQSTLGSKHPHLLYYHWKRNGDEEALADFLAKEGTTELDDAQSQVNLASYYLPKNEDKALALLFNALSLYDPGDVIDTDIFKSIASIFKKHEKHKKHYVWLKVLSLYQPDDELLSNNALENIIESHQLDPQFLNSVAKLTQDKIKLGSFRVPKY